ncbi:hypothetical protein ALC60_02560, partial [Trachymyrmex zeteki]
SHILNLVLCNVLKVNIKAASLFSLLNSISSFFKESLINPKIVYMLISLTLYKELKVTLKLILKPEL